MPKLDRRELRVFFSTVNGLPQADWGAIDMWINRRTSDPARQGSLRRGAAAAWLDELGDALPAGHERWRNQHAEGICPSPPGAANLARSTDHAIRVIERALVPVRGGGPIDPIAIVALESSEAYYSFTSHFYPDEGQWGTSGGVYVNGGPDSFPLIALPIVRQSNWSSTIAHELTHHALHGMELPSWVEEGFTQMMEERVTGGTHFRLDREMLERHRARWLDDGPEAFLSGEAFASAHDDTQELAYNLSQVIVRGWLSRDPRRFFAFARACRELTAAEAAREHLGMPLEDLVTSALAGPR